MMGFEPKAARIAFTVGLVALVFYTLYTIQRTLFIFVLAIFFAYMVYPLVRTFERAQPRRIPRFAALTAAFVLILTGLVLVAMWLGPLFVEQASRLGQQLPALLQQPGAIERLPLPSFLEPYGARIADFVRAQVQSGASAALPLAQRIGGDLLHFAGNAIFVIIIPILAFLLIANGPQIRELLRGAGTADGTTRWQRLIDDLDRLLGGYIRSLVLLSLITMVVYALFFAATGVPYGLLLAGIAAVLEFIPVFGPLLAAVSVLVIAGFNGYPHLLWIVIFIGAYRMVQDYVVAPRLMGEGVGVHPILVIFGLLAGDELAGVAGIFLSVPVIAAGLIVARHLVELRRDTRASQALAAAAGSDRLR